MLRAAALACVTCLAVSSSAFAQVQEVQQYTPPSINPRDNAVNRNSVSPYLNLTRGGIAQGQSVYQNAVVPQLQQRQAARMAAPTSTFTGPRPQMPSSLLNNSTFLSSSAALRQQYSPRATGGSISVRPTGHHAAFGQRLGYFGGR